MKKTLLITVSVFLYLNSKAQTNTFPTDGNVGIGSTSPTQKLTVDTKQTSFNAGFPQNTGTNQNGIMRLQVNGDSWGEALDFGMNVLPSYAWLQATNRGNLAISYNLSLNPNGGNLGIGSTFPTQKLTVDIKQTSSNAGFPQNTGTNQNGIMRLQVNGDSWGEALDFGMNVLPSYAWLQATNRGNLAISYNLSLNPNGGNVGIGTTTPSAKLDVTGEIKSYHVGMGTVDVNTSTKNYVNFSSNNHGSVLISSNLYCSGDDNLKIAKTHPTMSGSAIILPGNSQPHQGSILFYTTQPASVTADSRYNEAATMMINYNGNVGIGTTSPQEKLSVNGKIRAKEIKVETANWPDYVFEEDYQPASLQETEDFIKTHKHLPEMPSEAEVKAEGISLGEMNAKLLKKIEEITLHLIDLKKENTELKERIAKIENR